MASKDNDEEHIPLVKRKIVKKKKKDATQQSRKESDKEPITSQKEPRPKEEKIEKVVQELNIKLSPRKSPRGQSLTKEYDQSYKKKALFKWGTIPKRKGEREGSSS